MQRTIELTNSEIEDLIGRRIEVRIWSTPCVGVIRKINDSYEFFFERAEETIGVFSGELKVVQNNEYYELRAKNLHNIDKFNIEYEELANTLSTPYSESGLAEVL